MAARAPRSGRAAPRPPRLARRCTCPARRRAQRSGRSCRSSLTRAGAARRARRAQFRALADQLYRSERYHAAVRAAVVATLAAAPERYAPYALGEWDAYLAAAAAPGTWGDHVTLQARACSARSAQRAQEHASLGSHARHRTTMQH